MRRKKEEMYKLVSKWEASKETKTSFCKVHQINIPTFTYWVQKYKIAKGSIEDKDKSKKFIALELEGSSHSHSNFVEVLYPNGVRLRLNNQPSVNYLQSLVQITI